MTPSRIISSVLLCWLIAATHASAADPQKPPAHCGFLNELAQFDIGALHLSVTDAAQKSQVVAHAGRLQNQLRDADVASAFSELKAMRIEAYLAAQARAIRSPGDTSVARRNARTVHPLPWREQAFAQELALCGTEGGNVRPMERGVGVGDQGGTGGDQALTGQLRIPVGSSVLQADAFALLILALFTICVVVILRELVGRTQRRSRRVYCYVPALYSVGGRVRQGWLLDLSCHGCKLQTNGENWPVGTTIRIGVDSQELTGTVGWTSRDYAGVDLHPVLDVTDVDRIAFGHATAGLPAH